MKQNINWENIIDNFHGFEKLAVKFIHSKYKNVSWKSTPATRDGNTDAVAIIMGYQLHENQPIQWWMEAKYSHSIKQLTRYRIDSTVVSAILDGSVEKVVFITNIEVDAKTISDITEALKRSSCCKEVEFYTKYSLEYWLLTHPDIYLDFFKSDNQIPPMLSNDFIVSQEISYYNAISEVMAFRDPLKELIIGKEYIAYVSIFALREITVSIQVANHLKGIRFLSKVRNIHLNKGENTIRFHFRLNENYGYKYSKRTDVPMPVFKMDEINLISNYHIVVLRQNSKLLDLSAQKHAEECLKSYYQNYLAQENSVVITLDGKTGMGKSVLLDAFLTKHASHESIIFFHEFTESVKENVRILLELLIYIIFPYIPPETIDESYVDSIKNVEVKKILLNFIKYKNDHENILMYISQLSGSPALLPNKISISKRTVILDNMHLLSKKSAFFVAKIVCEIYEKKLPVFFVLCGQPYYFNSRAYEYLAEHCVSHALKLELCTEDILSNCNIEADEKYDLEKLNIFDMNATSLLLFQNYLVSEKRKISTLQELIIALRVFWISDIMEHHILDQFKTLFIQSATYRIILDKIYWSCQPIKVSDISEYMSELHYLLQNNLVKYNIDGELVASYSIYQSYYRKHFVPKLPNLNYQIGSAEELRIRFLTAADLPTLVEGYKQIKDLFEEKKYFKIDYILKDIFKSDRHMVLKNSLNVYEYYYLYYIYSYSAHQNGETDECQTMFEKIYRETKSHYQPNLLQLSLRCLWELGMINYENMEYEEVIHKKKMVLTLIEKINFVQRPVSKPCKFINYHDFRVLEAMIKRDTDIHNDETLYNIYMADMQTFGFSYRALSFSARYALTLCRTDITLCIEMLYNTGNAILEKYGAEDKHYVWCMFFYYFYRMIYEKNYSLFENTLYFHEKMRISQYGNYRKKLYAIAAYLYSIGDISGGNRYLFQDTIFPYEARRRYQAFYYETLALHEAIKGNLSNALRHLDQASSIFKNIKSYSSIPEHNKKVLVDGKFSTSKICFLINENMDFSVYYIDPRCAW